MNHVQAASRIENTAFNRRNICGLVALGEGGNSAPSSEVSGMVWPAAPSGLTATGGNGTVTLSWTAGSGATSYNIYEGGSVGSEAPMAVMSNIFGTMATVSGLTNSSPYYFTDACVNSAGTSAPSNQANATPTSDGRGKGSFELIDLLLGGALLRGRRALPAVLRRAKP